MSWYSNILTKTSSQISNLRSTLLASEADGDTEDDTHVCRVLRNYYTDKGRPFPPWLPPDPKAPAQAPQQIVYAQPQVGARYGGLQNTTSQNSGLSSLWDNNNNNNNGPISPPPPQSLRAGRAPAGGVGAGGRPNREEVQARPLPSQRPGSHQSATSTAGGGAAGGSSAQDRLRQRLWGGGARTVSPSNQGGPFQPPAQSGAGRSGGGGDYEDRFAPGGAYDPNRGGKPQMSANSPWSNGGDPYGAPPAQQAAPSRRPGLPSGPRSYR